MNTETNGIGKRIKAQRKQKNMTQEALAECVGVSIASISYIENGRRNVSFVLLLKIASAFGLSLDYLVFNRLPARWRDDYWEITRLLTDCDTGELEGIKTLVTDYIKLIRYERA